jgi:hypothetical protein
MKKIGFCAVHYTDIGKFTRWAIQDDWARVGEYTSARVAKIVSDKLASGTVRLGANQNDLVQEMLMDLVVEASSEMNTKVIPCRSFALMQHVGWPYFIIETGSTSGRSIRPIDAASWQKADRLIDQMEAKAGDSFVRIRTNGNQDMVLSRYGGRPTNIPTGTLTGRLAPLEKHLQNTDPSIPKGLRPFLHRSIPKIWHKF